jgi:molybdopterin-guanine dinucleotide biosynthesis protein A
VLLDAIVLAGGRSARLSGVPKAMLRRHGVTLVDTAVNAAAQAAARRIVVVGDAVTTVHADRVITAREDPPYGGPAAAIAAGLDALRIMRPDRGSAVGDPLISDPPGTPAADDDGVIVLACDLPAAAIAVTALTSALPLAADEDGIVAVDDSGRMQQLTAVYRRSTLSRAVAATRAERSLDGASVRLLVASLTLRRLAVPVGATDDIDTPDDAGRHGMDLPAGWSAAPTWATGQLQAHE